MLTLCHLVWCLQISIYKIAFESFLFQESIFFHEEHISYDPVAVTEYDRPST